MTDSTNVSGGVNLAANEAHIVGDVVGHDKIINITNNIVQQAQAARERQPLRVLAVIAAPVAGQREVDPPPASLSGRAEWKALRASTKVAPLLLARLRPPTALALRSICAPNNAGAFNIVHFICHGLPGALALEDERGLLKIVNTTELAAALKEGAVQLAVINACYSAAGAEESIAQALVAAGVRSVVAHRWPLIDPAAVLFSQALYRELAAGRSLRAAFDEAVQETTAQYQAEKGNAVLLGDGALNFPRPGGEVQPSQVIEGAALPDKAARFFGRGRELIQLADVLANPDLRGAALTGIGGIGKSALAFEAADRLAWRFDDRVAYVEASEFGFKAADGLVNLARGLGLKDTANPIDDLRDLVNRNPCLLLFDNMERAGSELYRLADFVSSFNMDAGSQVLFTLRPPLSDRFREVREINLHTGLDERAALDYVRTTAYNLNAAHEWQNINEARTLIQRVNGHPELMRLAIYRSLKTSFARVKQEVGALSGKLNEALSDLIGKQVAQAGELAQIALARLTIFPQPRMIVEAAQAACGDAVDGLDALVENGVIALEQDDVQRYALHPTAIDYARSAGKMQDAGLQKAKLRVIECYAQWGNEHSSDYDVLQAEHDNMLAALDWAWEAKDRDESKKAIVNDALGLREFWGVRGYWSERTTWLRRANELGSASQTDENLKQYSTNLHNLAVTLVARGDRDGALRLYQQSLDASERLGNQQGKAATLSAMAEIFANRGDLDRALDLLQDALVIEQEVGDVYTKAGTLFMISTILFAKGDLDKGTGLLQEVIALDTALGNLEGKADTSCLLAIVKLIQLQLDDAAKMFQDSLDLYNQIDVPEGKAIVLEYLAVVELARGNIDNASRFYRESTAHWEKLTAPDLFERMAIQSPEVKVLKGLLEHFEDIDKSELQIVLVQMQQRIKDAQRQ